MTNIIDLFYYPYAFFHRDQAQACISDPSSSDSRRGLKRSWKEASSGPVAGSSSDTPGKLTSAKKGKEAF